VHLASHVTAVSMLLTPTERTEVMSLLPRLDPQRMEVLKQRLLAMSVEQAATWIRENRPSLKAEAAS
jgi:hypothetical protein